MTGFRPAAVIVLRYLGLLGGFAWLFGPWEVARSQDAPDPSPPRYEIRAEIRLRGEARAGAGENPAREDAFAISRLRLDFTFRPSRHVTFFVQPQDSRVAGFGPSRNPRAAQDSLDLRQAWVGFGSEQGSWTLYAGRRVLSFMDQRLLGGRNWHNISPTWDGSMLTLRKGDDQLHMLAFTQVDVRDGFNVPSRTRAIYGAIASVKSWLPGQVVEPFFLTSKRPWDYGSNLGGLLHTAGSRMSGSFAESWDYQVILAGQTGGGSRTEHRAWAGIWGIGRTLEQAPARPRFGFEWTYASGDDDPLDNRRGTFDTLFSSPHRIYGEQDIVGLRNLKALKSGVELRPRKGLIVNADFLDYRLANRADGLYQTSFRRRIAPPEGGASSMSIGSEVNLMVRYQLRARTQFRVVVSRFFAGPFVTRNLPGGESQNMIFTELVIGL